MTDSPWFDNLTITERIEIIAAAKEHVSHLETLRGDLDKRGREIGAEIATLAYLFHTGGGDNIRAHLDRLLAEEATLKVDARIVALALDQARRRVAEITTIFDRTQPLSERDRLAKAEIVRRYGDSNNAEIADEIAR